MGSDIWSGPPDSYYDQPDEQEMGPDDYPEDTLPADIPDWWEAEPPECDSEHPPELGITVRCELGKGHTKSHFAVYGDDEAVYW